MKIDRSSWPRCELCSGKKVLYQSSVSTDLFMDKLGDKPILVTETKRLCPRFVPCSVKDLPLNSAFPISYCPRCGRPLTDKAWDYLEQRLQGWKHVEHKDYPAVEYNYTGIDDEKQRQAQEDTERLLALVRKGEAHGGDINATR